MRRQIRTSDTQVDNLRTVLVHLVDLSQLFRKVILFRMLETFRNFYFHFYANLALKLGNLTVNKSFLLNNYSIFALFISKFHLKPFSIPQILIYSELLC